MGQGSDDAVDRAKRNAQFSLVFEWAVKRVFTSYSVEITRPAGGARSLLHIRLKTGDAAFSVGWANPSSGTSELYTLGNTLARSKRHRGRELAVPPMQYNRFLEIAKGVLEDFGMHVTIVAFTSDDVELEAETASDAEAAEVEEALAESERFGQGRVDTLPYQNAVVERK
jgi:hypothetical protein